MSAVHFISDQYRRPLTTAIVFSAILAILSALMLDGGQAARLTAIGLLFFWACVLVGMWRRPFNPTRFDLVLIGWGCAPFVFGLQLALHVVWHLRGLE